MPVRKYQKNGGSGSRRGKKEPPTTQKTGVLSILVVATGLLLLLALVSYDPVDEARADIQFSDLWKVFTGDPQARAKADTTHNWLGLVGAMLSTFLIRSTIGYAALVVPFLLIGWGWLVMRGKDLSNAVTLTNHVLVGALLFSTSLGMIRLIFGAEVLAMEWSGLVGDFIASVLTQLLGEAGGAIVLIVVILVTVIYVTGLDLGRLAARVRSGGIRMLDWLARSRDHLRGRWEAAQRERANIRKTSIADVTITQPEREEPVEAVSEDSPARPRMREPGGAVEELEDFFIVRPRVEAAPPPDPVLPETSEELDYVFPSVELLAAPVTGRDEIDESELKTNADLLRDTLADFDVELESVSVTPGPVVTLYELVPATGVKISRIVSLENDIALKLAAKGIRIMAPIPGKSAVGVEIPNSHRSLVTIRGVINSQTFRSSSASLPLALGKTISGEVYTDDLVRMPHLLIAGSTGSGKSVGINTLLAGLFYKMHPADLKLVIIDPKKIEMAQYARLRSHFLAVSPDVNEDIVTTPTNAVLALRGVEFEMEKRYDRLAAGGVRNIVDYNDRVRSGRLRSSSEVTHSPMPYIIVVIDELADLMITAAREVEEPIARLAQLSRAVGIHLVVATQRPSVDVITGVIKANFPARMAYQVASKTDSRTILDMNGAEQLLGNGDMLYLASGSPKPVRLQNAYIAPDEVDALVEHIGRQPGYSSPFMLPSIVEKKRSAAVAGGEARDELFEEAAHLIVRHQQGSVSLLQRRLKVGYSRAARLVDELEAAGVVGPFDGSKARTVLVESEEELDLILNGQ
jgi:S-DNA-T family DNA segregation ATPase FtsK/SpoIIIE